MRTKPRSVLIAAPSNDAVTTITIKWAKKFEEWITKNYGRENLKVLYSNMASRKNFNDLVEQFDIFIPIGHGSAKAIAAQKGTMVDKKNAHRLKGMMVSAVCCSTAKTLGKSAMEKGCKHYDGYSDVLVFTTFVDWYGTLIAAPKALVKGRCGSWAYRSQRFRLKLKMFNPLTDPLSKLCAYHNLRCYENVAKNDK